MPTIDMTATGKNITRMMKAAGMTVKDLQEIFGFATPQAIYKWKNGTAMPTIDNLVILAVTLGCKIDDLLIVDMPVQGRNDCKSGTQETRRRTSSLTDLWLHSQAVKTAALHAAGTGPIPVGVTVAIVQRQNGRLWICSSGFDSPWSPHGPIVER